MADDNASSAAISNAYAEEAGRLRILFRSRRSTKSLVIQHVTVLFCALFFFILCSCMASLLSPANLQRYPTDDTLTHPCDLDSLNGTERLFAVDLRRVEDLSYVQAKAIQVCWDFVVGQGGRVLHAWILLKVMSDALVFLMESNRVPHELFISLSLTSSTFYTTISCLKLLWRKRKTNWEIRLTAFWALLAILHAVGFPVIWSASAGYVNPSERYYQLPDLSAIPSSAQNLTGCMQIFGVSRLGLAQDFITVPGGGAWLGSDYVRRTNPGGNYPNATAYYRNALRLVLLATDGNFSSTKTFPTSFNEQFWPEYAYVSTPSNEEPYGVVPWNFSKSEPRAPGIIPYDSYITLNGTTHFLNGSLLRFADNETCSASLWNCYSPSENLVCMNGQPLPADWKFPQSCVSNEDFVWGFSSFLLLLGLIFEAAWVSTVYMVWLNANTRSVLRRRGFGLTHIHANAALFAGLMRENVSDEDEGCTAEEMEKAMGKVGDVVWSLDEHDADQTAYVSMTARLAEEETQTKARRRKSVKRVLARQNREFKPSTIALDEIPCD